METKTVRRFKKANGNFMKTHLKSGEEIIIYTKDNLVTLALNGILVDELPTDLLAYWGFLLTTYKGSFYNSGEDSENLDIGQFNEKYPNSKWDIKEQEFVQELK